MIDDYRDLVLETEIQILSHALVNKYNLEEVKEYKFQRPELIPLFEEIRDIQANNYEPVIEALWDKYPIVYGRLNPHTHNSPRSLMEVAKLGKARIYTYDQLMLFLARVADEYKPLEVTLDAIIHNMRMIKGRL